MNPKHGFQIGPRLTNSIFLITPFLLAACMEFRNSSAASNQANPLVKTASMAGSLPGASATDSAGLASAKPTAQLFGEKSDTLAGRVKAGESFNSIVHGLRLSSGESNPLLAGIQANFKFKLYTGQKYRIVFSGADSAHQIRKFLLEDRDSHRRHILARAEISSTVAPQPMIYQVADIPVRTDTVAVSGELESNLYEAFLSKGETPALIQQITRIFAWDIDFFKDPRVGDAYSLLVEKHFGEDGGFKGYGQILSARYVNRGKAFYGILYRGAYYDQDGKSLEKMLLKVPLNFARLSSGFTGHRLHPILGVNRPHWGVDYAAPKGTPIFAAGDGTIEYTKWVNGYGKTIKIRHNGVYNTYYAHLNGFAAGMGAGRRVKQREIIGYLGMTGLATGPHLDYRVECHGQYINPTSLKMEAKDGVAKTEWQAFCSDRDSDLARMDARVYKNLAVRPEISTKSSG